jgi:drug/metabolite transporter (DMT)-like permease
MASLRAFIAKQSGVTAAVGAALLFGAGTPLTKLLLAGIDPWLLAALCYLGAGLGLGLFRLLKGMPADRLQRVEWFWFGAAILCGGVAAPVLLMFGLADLPASDAALLLNAESVFSVLLAWLVFRENLGRRVVVGIFAILAGALILTWPDGGVPALARLPSWALLRPSLCVLGACALWALDNNLTRKVSSHDAVWLAQIKGLAAGAGNLLLAASRAAALPDMPHLGGALVVGALSYGASLALFVAGLRQIGAARTSVFFAIAPFFGAVLALVLLHEPASGRLLAAGLLMACGVWLHLGERHVHEHRHEALEHDHEHGHDAHHQHTHSEPVPAGARHRHPHRHEPLIHTHAHFPDIHHRHPH